MITQAQIQERFNYNPDTGLFKYLVNAGGMHIVLQATVTQTVIFKL